MQVKVDFDKKISIKYDVCLIGSSPFCLYKASYLCNKGLKVLIVDENDVVGGAWKSRDIFNLKNAELGCHLILPTYNIYKFLNENIGANLIPMSPQPKRCFRKKIYDFTCIKPLIFYRFFLLVKIIKKIFSKFLNINFPKKEINLILENNIKMKYIKEKKYQFNKKYLKRILIILFNYSNIFETLELRRYKFLYPKKGAYEIVKKLLGNIPKNNLTIKNCMVVKKVKEIKRNLVKIEFVNGNSVYVKKIILTNQAHFEYLENSNKKKFYPSVRNYKQHLLLLIANDKEKKFSYIEFLDSNLIRRVSDISNYSAINKNNRLLCIELMHYEKDRLITKTFIDQIILELAGIKLINKKSYVVDFFLDNQTYISGSNNLRRYEKYFSSVEFIKTNNFSFLKNV